MDEMVKKLLEEEKRLRAEDPQVEEKDVTLSNPIDVEALLSTGRYITVEDYEKYRRTGILPDYYKG